ncbi:MAG: hypothetical protein EXR77_12415 [Myxococcales bacterium]|nr:hypothetical protein [Myxococcales bacterium]
MKRRTATLWACSLACALGACATALPEQPAAAANASGAAVGGNASTGPATTVADAGSAVVGVTADAVAQPAAIADVLANPPPFAVLEPVGPGGSLQAGATAAPIKARAIQRLTVDMLERSLPIVLGKDATGKPIHWYGTGTVPMTDDAALGRALGRPDYNTITDEDTKPSILYTKFMDDMARDVCQRLLDSDAQKPAADRTLLRFVPLDGPTAVVDIQKNLRYLVLRFWGRYVPPSATATGPTAAGANGIESLQTLWQAAAGPTPQTKGQAAQGWRAVCVGLLVSPAFHLY